MLLYIVAAIVVFVLLLLFKAGYFSSIEVSVKENPPFLNETITVYYKHFVGSYSSAGAAIKEAVQLLPAGATGFGVFYDNPKDVKEHLLQSAVGVVFARNGKDLYEANYSEQLRRWGMEKMVLPPVKAAVTATRPLSLLSPIPRIYQFLMKFIQDNRLEVSMSVEFYHDNEVTVFFPLDHQDEFIIPEKLSVKELESKLARKKFDSDEETSESELSGEEELDESDVDGKGDEVKLD